MADTKPNAYTLTPEHFARARANIEARRVKLNADIDTELAHVNADEAVAGRLAEHYQLDAALPAAGEPANREAKAKGGLANAKRPYKPAEDARIAAAWRGELEQLAEDLGRPYLGVLKRHEVLLRKQRKRRARVAIQSGVPSSDDPEAWVEVHIADAPLPSSEDPEVSEPTTVRETPLQPIARSTLTGRTVDNGPLDQRVYGRGFESGDRE